MTTMSTAELVFNAMPLGKPVTAVRVGERLAKAGVAMPVQNICDRLTFLVGHRMVKRNNIKKSGLGGSTVIWERMKKKYTAAPARKTTLPQSGFTFNNLLTHYPVIVPQRRTYYWNIDE